MRSGDLMGGWRVRESGGCLSYEVSLVAYHRNYSTPKIGDAPDMEGGVPLVGGVFHQGAMRGGEDDFHGLPNQSRVYSFFTLLLCFPLPRRSYDRSGAADCGHSEVAHFFPQPPIVGSEDSLFVEVGPDGDIHSSRSFQRS